MRSLLSILLFLLSLQISSQNDVGLLKNEIDTLLSKKETLKAIQKIEKLVNLPNKDTISNYSLYKVKIAILYNSIDSIEQSKNWYKAILKDTLIKDNVKSFWLGGWENKGNFKHLASNNLGVTYFKEGNLSQSIKYYKLSLDSFPYYNISGTSINKVNQRISRSIVDVYSKLGKVDSAFLYLLPYIKDAMFITESRSNMLNKTAEVLQENNLDSTFLAFTEDKSNKLKLVSGRKHILQLDTFQIEFKDYTSTNHTKADIELETELTWHNILLAIREELLK